MTLYQAWCYRKLKEERKRKEKILMYFRIRLKG